MSKAKDLSKISEEHLTEILQVLNWRFEYQEDTTFGMPDVVLRDKCGNKCKWYYDSNDKKYSGYVWPIRNLRLQGQAYLGRTTYDQTSARLCAISALKNGLRWKVGTKEVVLPKFEKVSELKAKLDIQYGEREISDDSNIR